MNGFGEVVDGKLYIGIGMENYSLEIKEDKPFLRKIGLRIEEDPLIGNNESEKIINLSLRNISEVGLWYEFKIGDRELEVVETSGQQDEYFVPWSHYTLKMDVKKGSIIRFIPEGTNTEIPRVEVGYGLEFRNGQKTTVLAKTKGNHHLLLTDRYVSTYRLELNVY